MRSWYTFAVVELDWKQYRHKRVCVALSGGADSVCLLHLFLKHAGKGDIQVSAVTCEHGIRGEESLRDLDFVKNLCAEWSVPLILYSEDIPARAKERGCGLEEAGRAFRYDCFYRILEEGKADLVATAHHADDAAETVLFRLARGTSISGLPAIKEGKGIVRPLLNFSKQEILRYAAENKLRYVEDSTNDDLSFSRNAIRKTVLPALENIVPAAGAHLAAFARRAGEDDEYLQSLAERELKPCKEGYRISASLPRPVFLRAAIKALAALGRDRDYTENFLREIEKLTALQSGRRVRFGSAEAVREGDEILFHIPRPAFCGEIAFSTGSFEVGEYLVEIGEEERAGALYADLKKFPQGCVVRTRREGDIFTPFGGREKPLKKFLTDKKIPARKGAALPLIAKGNEVYLVFGTEISERVKVTDDTLSRAYFSMRDKA